MTLACVTTLVMIHSVVCQPASAQRLFDRWRARIEARRMPQQSPPQQYQQPLSPGSSRILATPIPGQNANALPPAGETSGEGNNDDAETTPSFGIEVSPVFTGRYRGLQVLGFSSGSNAPKVGIRPGDVIVSIDGMRTESLDAVRAAQRRLEEGAEAVVYILRNGRMYQTKLASIEGSGDPSDATRSVAKPPVERDKVAGSKNGPTLARPRGSLGLEARDAAPQRGVLVVTVKEGSAGELSGIQPNDRIVSAAGRLVRDTNGLVRELALLNPGDAVTLGIVRGNAIKEIEAEMGGPGGVPARSATERGEARVETPSQERKPDSQSQAANPASTGESLLGGVGSALGSFFSGSGNSDAGESGAERSQRAQSTGVDNGSNGELPAPEPRDGLFGGDSDPLALPDDEFGDNTLPAPAGR
ncbi:MAG: PDZ domain-containing protein [Rhodopirellula sp. JB044]|uniref:PDZ domain-containing protein n=1 Tax=Rhodopirellula sp. JB044 TaxID=3342844 RepID=UPI00370B5753